MKPLAPITNRRRWPGTEIFIAELIADIPGHPVGSTVSDRTLLDAGYRLPEVA